MPIYKLRTTLYPNQAEKSLPYEVLVEAKHQQQVRELFYILCDEYNSEGIQLLDRGVFTISPVQILHAIEYIKAKKSEIRDVNQD